MWILLFSYSFNYNRYKETIIYHISIIFRAYFALQKQRRKLPFNALFCLYKRYNNGTVLLQLTVSTTYLAYVIGRSVFNNRQHMNSPRENTRLLHSQGQCIKAGTSRQIYRVWRISPESGKNYLLPQLFYQFLQ